MKCGIRGLSHTIRRDTRHCGVWTDGRAIALYGRSPRSHRPSTVSPRKGSIYSLSNSVLPYYTASMSPTAASDISRATYGLRFELEPMARSNEGNSPAYGGPMVSPPDSTAWISTAADDGRGAQTYQRCRGIFGAQPSQKMSESTGLTIWMTMRVSNVVNRDASVVSCNRQREGLLVTTQEARLPHRADRHIYQRDDQRVTRDIKLSTNAMPPGVDEVALIIRTSADDTPDGTVRKRQPHRGRHLGGGFDFQQDFTPAHNRCSSGQMSR